MFQEGINGLYFYAKFEVLTFTSYGDINQNGVKIGVRHRIFMKFRVKGASPPTTHVFLSGSV